MTSRAIISNCIPKSLHANGLLGSNEKKKQKYMYTNNDGFEGWVGKRCIVY